jgi:uncharacterized metal-binding protein YceD (DUF177 family)
MASPRPGSARGLSALDDLRLQDIPEEGLRFDQPLPRAWLTERLASSHGLRWAPRSEGRVDVEVSALGPVDRSPPVRIRGRASAAVETDCVRCLEAVHQDVRAQVDLTLFSSTEVGNPEASPESADEGRYEGRTIPLPEVLREHLLLELDMNPVCSDVDGCDARTRALIEEANRPAREADAEDEGAIDPRWAALARLKADRDH